MLLADFGENGVNSISGMEALDTTMFGGDFISPFVSQFTLDLNTNQITLSFSEVIDVAIFDQSNIVLQSSQNVASDVFVFSSLTKARFV